MQGQGLIARRRHGLAATFAVVGIAALTLAAGLAPAAALPAPPVCLGKYVSDVQVSDVGSTTATVTWTGLPEHERFLVYASTGVGSEHRTSPIQYAPTSAYTFTDLVPDRTYKIQVQGVCSNSFGPYTNAPSLIQTLP